LQQRYFASRKHRLGQFQQITFEKENAMDIRQINKEIRSRKNIISISFVSLGKKKKGGGGGNKFKNGFYQYGPPPPPFFSFLN
jgi:hypothetical protein